jgi:hypothetical protein
MRIDIVGLFVEAGRMGRERAMLAGVRVRRPSLLKHPLRARIDALFRRGWRRAAILPQTVDIRSTMCAACGQRVELREGSTRWVHIGFGGLCGVDLRARGLASRGKR